MAKLAVPIMTPPTVAPGSAVVMRRHDTSPDAVPNSFCVSSPTKHHQQGHMVSRYLHSNVLELNVIISALALCTTVSFIQRYLYFATPVLGIIYRINANCLLITIMLTDCSVLMEMSVLCEVGTV